MTQDLLKVSIVGVGNWGRNVARCFSQAQRCKVEWICDLDEKTLAAQSRHIPHSQSTTDFEKVLQGDSDAIVIATKATTHYGLAAKAFEAGKHVYVEKPLCLSTHDAEKLVAMADKFGKKLMVGHLLLYHPCVDFLSELVSRKKLGSVRYMYTQRVNLGIVRQDENAWWSLAPHDVSVVCHLFGSQPTMVSAIGQCDLQEGIEDVVFAALRFADGRLAHIHVSWLDPHKIRKMTVVGSERMVTFDDMEPAEKIRVYDKGAEVTEGYGNFAQSVAIRSGEITIPRIPAAEPLRLETQHFVDCVLDDKPMRTDGADGLRVVRVLEAGEKSLRCNGEPVEISVSC